jgi:hypothetical protein
MAKLAGVCHDSGTTLVSSAFLKVPTMAHYYQINNTGGKKLTVVCLSKTQEYLI